MIKRAIVKNYRVLQDADIEFSEGTCIIVGDNESGKSTLLEAIHLALSGRIGNRSVKYRLHPWMFNHQVTQEFVSSVEKGEQELPPEIQIELYFQDHDDLQRLKGTNNLRREDCPGIKLRITLDDEYADEYKEYITRGQGIHSIPMEYFGVEWLSFANEAMSARRIPIRAHLVDASTLPLERGSNRYLLEIVQAHLERKQRVDLAVAYRQMKQQFLEEDGVKAINEQLATRQGEFSTKALSVALDAVNDLSWEDSLIPHLDAIPMPLVGKGEQSASKIWMAMHSESKSNIFLVEEPENHLSHARLNSLISRLAEKAGGKQLILTTHSSFVINKLGINDVVLFNRGKATRLTELEASTRDYFRKLPGHDTLRLILAKRAILVEGPSDELVVQKAYHSRYGHMPLENYVDVISVRSLAFKRFLEIAKAIQVPVTVVFDNDGDPERKGQQYAEYSDLPNVKICYSQNETLPTLEPQMLAANGLGTMNAVLGKEFDTDEQMRDWMSKNKTDVALRILDYDGELQFPDYIIEAIDE